jgi:hypothetical protein
MGDTVKTYKCDVGTQRLWLGEHDRLHDMDVAGLCRRGIDRKDAFTATITEKMNGTPSSDVNKQNRSYELDNGHVYHRQIQQ